MEGIHNAALKVSARLVLQKEITDCEQYWPWLYLSVRYSSISLQPANNCAVGTSEAGCEGTFQVRLSSRKAVKCNKFTAFLVFQKEKKIVFYLLVQRGNILGFLSLNLMN